MADSKVQMIGIAPVVAAQFGAALRMLEEAIRLMPQEWWELPPREGEAWVLAHHTVFWLNFYLTPPDETFTPPTAFGLEELDPEGRLPERAPAREDLLQWLHAGRREMARQLEEMDETLASQDSPWRPGLSRLELLLYNLRHVQHGAAQLNALLRRQVDRAAPWCSREAEASST